MPRVSARPQDGDSVLVVPGAVYAAGGLHRFFMGAHYRDLWATPIRVPLLDLDAFAGGLTALSAHAGSQTTSLRFRGADGRTYQFRSVFKTPTAGLDADLQGTLVANMLQDGASASHPLGTLVVAPLLAAAGVLHAEPHLAVMPDDPQLGEFREAFAGLLGTIEERPNEAEDGLGGFGAAIRVIGPDRLFERIDESPDDQVDVPAFLTARLIDILIGDRDRHRDNWRWALMDDSGPTRYWEPISRDHDEAFVKLDGLLLWVATHYHPQLVSFGPTYANPQNLNWHAREIDRRFLAGVSRAEWVAAALEVQTLITDEVIDRAIERLPTPMRDADGGSLAGALRQRRDGLVAEVTRYYRFLAREVEIHATDAPEVVEIVREDDRFILVTLRAADRPDPYFTRRFDARETSEIRLSLWGGRDRVVVRGEGDAPIRIRVVGGSGQDALVDASRAGGIHFYDQGNNTSIELGPGSSVSQKEYPEWVGSDLDRYPPQEWGSRQRFFPYMLASPDVGVILGAGMARTRYGFRKRPFSSELSIYGGVSMGEGWGLVESRGEFRREASDIRFEVAAGASGIDLLHFYGLGNDTDAVSSSTFFDIEVNTLHFDPRVVIPVTENATLHVGPTVRYTSTDNDPATYFTTVADTLYGAGHFGSVGVEMSVEMDSRDQPVAATRGVLLRLSGRMVPPIWDVEDTFGRLETEVRTYLTAVEMPLRPTLALRAGAKKVFGIAPFQESVFLGGRDELRGWDSDRFAGDAALYGSVEGRLRLGQFRIMLPGDIGVYGLFDAGRVYVDGNTPGGWHTGVGGGVWMSFLDSANTFSMGFATGAERTAFYGGLGFAF